MGLLTMTDNQQTTPVVLRAWRTGGGVFALFPTLPSDEHGRYCNAYEHVGQHGGADYRLCIRTSRPATAMEGAPCPGTRADRLPVANRQTGYRVNAPGTASRSAPSVRGKVTPERNAANCPIGHPPGGLVLARPTSADVGPQRADRKSGRPKTGQGTEARRRATSRL